MTHTSHPITRPVTAATARFRPLSLEVNNEKTKTIPDQALSVQEIMRRWANGMPMEGAQPVFYEDDELPDLKKMDLEEVAQLAMENTEYLAKHKKDADEKFRKKQKQDIIDEHERESKKNILDKPHAEGAPGGTEKKKSVEKHKMTVSERNPKKALITLIY